MSPVQVSWGTPSRPAYIDVGRSNIILLTKILTRGVTARTNHFQNRTMRMNADMGGEEGFTYISKLEKPVSLMYIYVTCLDLTRVKLRACQTLSASPSQPATSPRTPRLRRDVRAGRAPSRQVPRMDILGTPSKAPGTKAKDAEVRIHQRKDYTFASHPARNPVAHARPAPLPHSSPKSCSRVRSSTARS